MSEALRKFWEFVAEQGQGLDEQVVGMDMDELIAFAAEKGFTLTEGDFGPSEQDDEGELTLEEAEGVAGGENLWNQEYQCKICKRWITFGNKARHERDHKQGRI